MANYVYCSNTGDGFYNLAADGFFLDKLKPDDALLYFYINSNAVIIGRHQNAWRECAVENLEKDGVQLVRRHTGGGAVYHDEGNLNFSFIMPERVYDVRRQLGVIMNAVRGLGLSPELSGRNDILIDGKKFSGNAFGKSGKNRSHHGTLLVNADLTRLASYLKVSDAKLQAKGVGSVKARVVNLNKLNAEATVEGLKRLIIDSFKQEYGGAEPLVPDSAMLDAIEKRRAVQRSWEWRFGKTPEFELLLENRFSFGEMQIHLTLKHGAVSGIKVYSDCLDTTLAESVEIALIGCRFIKNALSDALLKIENEAAARELSEYVLTNDFRRL